jgi:Cyclin C-terminal domain
VSRFTDAEFIYAPSQIALAAFYLASEELAEQWARAKDLGQSGLNVIKEAATMINQASEQGIGVDLEQVREVDKRLRLCKNPEKIPGTKACVLMRLFSISQSLTFYLDTRRDKKPRKLRQRKNEPKRRWLRQTQR